MGRARQVITFIRQLLEGRHDDVARTPWTLDSLEKVQVLWPSTAGLTAKSHADQAFSHLRRLYRYGFRLNVASDGLRLRQFFADGELYRPEGYSRESQALLADLSNSEKESGGEKPIACGQCQIARAKPVLKALGFPDLDSDDSYAIQFGGLNGERWIFIDSRPEVFRREAAAVVAARLARDQAMLTVKPAKPDEGPSL